MLFAKLQKHKQTKPGIWCSEEKIGGTKVAGGVRKSPPPHYQTQIIFDQTTVWTPSTILRRI